MYTLFESGDIVYAGHCGLLVFTCVASEVGKRFTSGIRVSALSPEGGVSWQRYLKVCGSLERRILDHLV